MIARSGGCRSTLLDGDDIVGACPDGPGESPSRDGGFGHFGSNVVSASLGEDVAVDGSRVVAHAAGEVAEAEAESGSVEVLRDGAGDQGFSFTDAGEFFAGVSEIFPCRVARADGSTDLDGDAFVDHQLAQGGAAAGFPVAVEAAVFGDQLAHFAVAGRRGVANGVRHFVREPERDELGFEAECAGVRVGFAREVFQGDEDDAFSVNDQLTGIGGADTGHEYDVDIDVRVEDFAAMCFRGACECHDVDSVEHVPQVVTRRMYRGANYLVEVRSFGIEHVVDPVRLEDPAVRFVVLEVGGDAISAVEDGEKVGNQIDQHRPRKYPFPNRSTRCVVRIGTLREKA